MFLKSNVSFFSFENKKGLKKRPKKKSKEFKKKDEILVRILFDFFCYMELNHVQDTAEKNCF